MFISFYNNALFSHDDAFIYILLEENLMLVTLLAKGQLLSVEKILE